MPFVNAVETTLPQHPLGQDEVREMGKRILKGKVPFLDQALALFRNAGVDQRYLVRDINEILDRDELGWRNSIYRDACIEMGISLTQSILDHNHLKPEEIDMVITTSCTGFMIPSLDAYLINHFRMRPDTKRLPITELGCAAGAMALSRAREYLLAHPDDRVLLIAVELPSLTYRTKDFRVANLVSAALFGDGAAACLLSNRPGPCELLASRTHFYYETPDLMGFDLDESGFQILLDKRITQLIRDDFSVHADTFLKSQELSRDQLQHFVFHPGGRKILDTLVEVLEIDEADVAVSRDVLRRFGNLSSASVLWVLAHTLEANPKGLGLMAAFGPGFNAELLTLEFHEQEQST